MDTVEFARVVQEFGPGAALLVEPGSAAAAHVPARWAGIAGSEVAWDRCAAALALWPREVVDLLPRFASVLARCLEDVRVCLLRGDWVLLYGIRNRFREHEFRIGWDPATFGAAVPAHWDALPEALREFLTSVHAGFTDLDRVSFGPVRPRDMLSYAELGLLPVRNWQAGEDIPVDRAMLVTRGLGGTYYFASPDLPAGTIGWEAGGNLDRPLPFGPTLDDMMSRGFPPATAPEPVAAPGPPPRVARAVVWNAKLTEDTARARIHELVGELSTALGGQLRVEPLDETMLPCDDDAGGVSEFERLDARFRLEPPPPDRARGYLPVLVRIWEQRGWKVDASVEADGVVARARTADWFELVLSCRDDVLRLTVASPGMARQPSG
ncbi:hypothetical protein ACFYTQ_20935 [Nocardia sp. NPDC004068]|uniref:hypothetical protein n=1 Tax=Nocardia sp. NPDC004068 TaxID=3364303 RepID=UPI0036AF7869